MNLTVTKPIFDTAAIANKVLVSSGAPTEKQPAIRQLIESLGESFNTAYPTIEALQLHGMRQGKSDIATVRSLAQELVSKDAKVAAELAKELQTLFGTTAAQINDLVTELRDGAKDGTALNEAAAAQELVAKGKTAQGTQPTAAKNTIAKTKPNPPTPRYSAILAIFGNNNQALQDSTEQAATALFTVNGGTLLKGDEEIKTIISAAKEIPADKSPKQTVEQIATELNGFAQTITAKSTGDFKAAFEKLSPEAQQALKYMAETKLSIIYNRSLAALYAAPIKSDSILLTSVTNQLDAASFKPANPPETEETKIQRQVQFYEKLANVIGNYQRQKQSLPQDMPEAAKQDRLRAIGTSLNAGLEQLLKAQPITEDEAKELKHQISIAQVEKNPGEAAKGTHDFLSKIMKNLGSAQGLTLLTFALPLVAKLISFIPGIGNTLAGWTTAIAEKSTTIAQTFISLRGLTSEASKT